MNFLLVKGETIPVNTLLCCYIGCYSDLQDKLCKQIHIQTEFKRNSQRQDGGAKDTCTGARRTSQGKVGGEGARGSLRSQGRKVRGRAVLKEAWQGTDILSHIFLVIA